MASAVSPVFGEVLGSAMNLVNIIGDQDPGEFAQQFIDGLTGFIDQMLPAVMQIIPPFLTAFIEGVPRIVDSLSAQLPVLIDGLLAALPDVITALVDALPAVIDAIVDAIPLIITAIIEHLPTIIKALLAGLAQAFILLLKGLWQALLAVLKGIWAGILNWLAEKFPRLFGDQHTDAPTGEPAFEFGDTDLGPHQMGTPFVQRDGTAYLHRGEAVVPAELNPYGRGGSLGGTVVNVNLTVQAFDARSFLDRQDDIYAALREKFNRLGLSLGRM
jgi:hypothetical protein